MAADLAEAIVERARAPDATVFLRLSVNRPTVQGPERERLRVFEVDKIGNTIVIRRDERSDAIRVRCDRDSTGLMKTIWSTLISGELSKKLQSQEYAYQAQNVVAAIGCAASRDGPATACEQACVFVGRSNCSVPDQLVKFAVAMSDPRVSIEAPKIESRVARSSAKMNPASDKLRVKLLREGARQPSRGSALAAGYDLYACEDATVAPHETALVGTGVAVAVPSGTYGRIAPRSGVSTKGVMVNAGVVDEDYRGELRVVLHNMRGEPFEVRKGDRIAQLICECIRTPAVELAEELGETLRGDSGFGSTGA